MSATAAPRRQSQAASGRWARHDAYQQRESHQPWLAKHVLKSLTLFMNDGRVTR